MKNTKIKQDLKNSSPKINKSKIVSIIILICLSSMIIYSYYYEVLEPSYVSFAQSCLNIQPEVYGYYQAGETSTECGNVTIKINNNLPTKERIIVMKHEIIHYHQLAIRRTEAKCYNLYFMEMEAYTFQKLPMILFRFFYM